MPLQMPALFHRYASMHSTKKREVPGSSSSSHEVPPPVSHRKPSSSKEKEAISHKIIIELDDDDEEDDQVMILNGNAGKRAKGKETLAVGSTSTRNGAFDLNMPYEPSSDHDAKWNPFKKSNEPMVDGLNPFKPSHSSSGFKISENQNRVSPVASAEITKKIQQRHSAFKKFDMVEDFSDHKFSKYRKTPPPPDCAKKIQKEWQILRKGLPDTIFVRVYESRIDLLSAVIVGAQGTPYHDGLYFFDVYFPSKYPQKPPKVHYCSGGLTINPNLFETGKVCLSLLGTVEGEPDEEWVPGKSTLLQVLVSIQALILNAKPFLNEPVLADYGPEHEYVFAYNEEVFTMSLETMLNNIRRPPKHFEDFVIGHFLKHGRDILFFCKAYMDGAQVGCLVKGGVQDVDEGHRSCSQKFKNNLAALITRVVNAFSQIGVEDCDEFLSLAQKATGEPEPIFYMIG